MSALAASADAPPRMDSRVLAERFDRRHHNVLAAVDLVLAQCPEAAAHIRFEQHAVTAGLGGTRYVRHALLDRTGFMLLAMAFPSTQREIALETLMRFGDRSDGAGA